MTEESARYLIAISLIKKLGPINAKKLITLAGSPEAFFQSDLIRRSRLKTFREIAEQIRNDEIFDQADRELEFMEKNGIQLIPFYDDSYPYRLKQCADSPLILYVKGKADLNARKILAVVGTRKYSTYGRLLCERLISSLEATGVIVVSGLALGIDTISHVSALKNNLSTIAVLGHGHHLLYPPDNRKLAEQIEAEGALITEFGSTSPFLPGNFASRNRIIAGMSDATIVVESDPKGGSMITAELATSYNRDVFTFPFRVGDKNSGGCHQLIRDNLAALIENGEDLMKAMNWKNPGTRAQLDLFSTLNESERNIVGNMSANTPIRADDLAAKCSLKISVLLSALLQLEFKNTIRSLPGGMYILNS